MRLNISSLILAIVLFTMVSCEKTNETFVEEYPVSTFFSLKIGDSAMYRLDSLEFTVKLQNANILNSYLVKEFVTDTLRDNLNQLLWKITRYSNKDTSGKGFWQYLGDYYVRIQQYQVDIIENNLNFIKLKAPVRESFSWTGNSILPVEAYPQFDFSIDDNMAGWNYNYLSVGATEVLEDNTSPFTGVCTIEHVNQSLNVDEEFNDVISSEVFASKELSIEKYAANKGLVYKEQALWEYQPTRGKKIGFVLKMWRIN